MAVLLEDIVRSLELWLKIVKKPQPFVDPDLDPVLLVPGIAGSILKAVDDQGKEEQVWVRILGADHEFREKLWSKFDASTGETVSLDPNIKIFVPEDRYGLYAIDCLDPNLLLERDCVCYFHDMIVEMLKWGFQEGKTLFGFGYDFRQSNRLEETLECFGAKLKSIHDASGGKKINIITHSMGGLLVKCFMCLHTHIFEKYVKSWIAIAAPFQGAPGYITTSLLNGMSFVNGWQQNLFISKWSMQQLLIECPSIYELMASPSFDWKTTPLLEIWKGSTDADGESRIMLESYEGAEIIDILKQALAGNRVVYNGVEVVAPFNLDILKWANETHRLLSCAKVPAQVKFYNIYGINNETPHSVCYGSEQAPVTDPQQILSIPAKYICVDGDGTVPTESAKADGLKAVARVGVPGDHRGIICDRHVFRILKHWLKADHDPYYNPMNDYVILPTAFEMEKFHEEGLEVTSLKEEWELISDDKSETADKKPLVSSISVSQVGKEQSSQAQAHGEIIIYPQKEGKQHVELRAVSVSN
ncbi:hypothetical protein Sjap_003760 [Stephania japonica]|uniref:Lecithin-cholesterol acyltransferase-like 4 n=1 Tax=Stephania japonica TaxID=461633 RepID=A0AAP0PVC3_9MAGN